MRTFNKKGYKEYYDPKLLKCYLFNNFPDGFYIHSEKDDDGDRYYYYTTYLFIHNGTYNYPEEVLKRNSAHIKIKS